MYIVTIEKVGLQEEKSFFGFFEKTVREQETVYYQELDSIDLVAVISAINETKK